MILLGRSRVPHLVLFAASRLPLIDRNQQVIRMLDSGQLSTGDGSLTKEQFLKHNRQLLKAIEYLWSNRSIGYFAHR